MIDCLPLTYKVFRVRQGEDGRGWERTGEEGTGGVGNGSRGR